MENPNELAESKKVSLNKRLECFCWGLFLIFVGILMIAPIRWNLDGVWMIGAGIILLGMNAARHHFKIRVSISTIVLGIIAVILGLNDFLNLYMSIFPLILILIGAGIMLRSFLAKENNPDTEADSDIPASQGQQTQ